MNQDQLKFDINYIMNMSEKKEIKKENHKLSWDGVIIPATKVSPQVIEILRTTKSPQIQMPHQTTISEAAQIYYEEYRKLFSSNRTLNQQLITAFEDRNKLAQIYNRLRRQETQFDDGVRRKRRFASEIKRDFPCPALNCHKSYGSEGSLTQHVKLKHQEFYRSGKYQIMLQQLVDSLAIRVAKNEPHLKAETEQNKVPVKIAKDQVKTKNQAAKIEQKTKVKNEVKVKNEPSNLSKQAKTKPIKKQKNENNRKEKKQETTQKQIEEPKIQRKRRNQKNSK